MTDNFTVLVGAVVPMWLAGGDGANLILGAKLGTRVDDKLHFAAGFETMIVPVYGNSVFGFLFANTTVGDSEAHATISARSGVVTRRRTRAGGPAGGCATPAPRRASHRAERGPNPQLSGLLARSVR